jgi:hypothetical protein
MILARKSSSSRLRLVRHRSGLFFCAPTILFRSTNGGLEEALDVVIRSDGTAADGAKITVNGKRSSLKLDPHTSWGEQKQRIYVPDFERPAHATAELTVAGKIERSSPS